MTILTDEGLILLAPEQDPTTYLLQLQYRNFKEFVDTNPVNRAIFTWLQVVSEEDSE